MKKLPSSLSGCAPENTPIICQEKGISGHGKCATYYKNICAFLRVNKLFKRFTIKVDAQNVSLLPQTLVLKNIDPTTGVAVMAQLRLG
jgi:hypothetical protein